MKPDLHPDLDELILYCMGTADAQSDADANDRLRRHLEGCAECRAQASHLLADLSLVAMTVPQIAPPASAKDRLMKAAAGVSVAAGDEPAKQAASAGAGPAVLPMKPRRHSPGLIWGGWVAAAACLLYAVQLREANQGMRQQLQTETAEIIQANTSEARAKEVLDVLSSPQAEHVTLISAHAKPEPTGHAVYLRSRGALVFTASNLVPLPPNKTYELWVIPADGTAPIPAGTFQPNTKGMASVLLPKLPAGVKAKAFGVTLENAGGSATPTMPILLAGG
jgi:hypothetical protein